MRGAPLFQALSEPEPKPAVRAPAARRAKRALDVAVASVALVLLSPLIAVVAVAVRVGLGGPVLFRQQRPGYLGRPFSLVKFRTMRDATDASGRPLPDGVRLTRFGALLRSLSLDELPELWNVLRGDMSLVGPRPLLNRYTPYFTARERLRFTVPPGITGLAQVRGRNEVSWTERLAYDVEYVEHWSLWLDLRILSETLVAVVARRGVHPDANVLMRDLDDERRAADEPRPA